MSIAARVRQRKIATRAAEQEKSRKAALKQTQAKAVKSDSAPPPFEAQAQQESSYFGRMPSPALRSKQAKLARLAVEHGAHGPHAPERDMEGPEASEYQMLLAALGEDMRQLHDIQSTEAKIEAKRKMVDRYLPHVEGSLEAAAETGKAVQDEVLTTMMLWLFDIGEFDRGLDIAEHVLRYGLELPERFRRTPGCLVAEEVAVAALDAQTQGEDFDLHVLQRAAALTADRDMPDEARAKLHKAIGKELIRAAEAAAAQEGESAIAGAEYHARKLALEHYRRALALNKRIGVKKEFIALSNWVEKNRPPEQPEAQT